MKSYHIKMTAICDGCGTVIDSDTIKFLSLGPSPLELPMSTTPPEYVLKAELDAANQSRADLTALLREASTALDDWTHTFAPEYCHEARVKEARERIQERGGTCYYIAELQERIHNALKPNPPATSASTSQSMPAPQFTQYKNDHDQTCCGQPLRTLSGHNGGGSHYWSLKCDRCGNEYAYDTYRFILEKITAVPD